MNTFMQVYTNLDTHWGSLDGGTVSRGLGMSGTAGVDHLWLTVAVSHTHAHKNTHTNVSHSHFLAIKPSSSQYMPWLRGGCLQMAVQLSTIPSQPNNSLAVKWQE